jgi:hypothetical protein
MNLSITKTGVGTILSIMIMLTLIAPSLYVKLGALLIGLAIMVWATTKVEGFYTKSNKKIQAVWLSILGALTILMVAIYISA